MRIKFSNFLIGFLIVVIIVNGLLFTPKAKAFLGIGDAVFDSAVYNELVVINGNILITNGSLDTVNTNLTTANANLKTIIAGQTTTLTKTIAQWLKDDAMKALRDTIAKRLMDYIVNETAKWIQGGGDPMFISDWNQFAHNAFSIAAGTVIEQTLPFLCSPFKLQVQLALQPVPYYQQITCTLDSVKANLTNFYNNFKNGGWITYGAAWQPQGNFFGAVAMAHDQMLIQGAAAAQAATNEGLAGSGFLGQKQCKGSPDGKTVLTPDQFAALSENTLANTSKYQKDFKGNYCQSGDLQNVSPGAAVGYSVANMITSDSQWSANIQSWLSILVNALINKIFSEGLQLVGTGTTKSLGSYEKNENYQPPDNSSSTNVDKQQMIGEVQPLLDEWQYLLKDKNQSLTSASSTKEVLQKIQSLNCQTLVSGNIQGVQVAISKLKNDIDTSVKDINDLVKRINRPGYPSRSPGVLADLNNLTSDITNLQTEFAKAGLNNIQAMQADIKLLTDAITDLQLNINNTTISNVEAVQNDTDTLTSVIDDLQTEINAAAIMNLQNIQTDIKRLTDEIGGLNVKISEANNLIKQIDDADFTDVNQTTSAQSNWRAFINKYQTTNEIAAMTSGSDRQAADTEAERESAILTAVQKSLATCQGH